MTGDDARVAALRTRLATWPVEESLLVLDLDGTLHRGRFGWARGLSNIDLGFEIGWLLRPFGLPVPPPVFSGRVLGYAVRERRLRRAHGDTRAYYARAIALFRERLLESVPRRIVERAAERIVGLAHPDLLPALRAVAVRFGDLLIVSKAFDVVVAAYAQWIGGALDREVGGEGNPTWGTGEDIFSGEDKAAALGRHLDATRTTHCLIVGDTAQDAAMRGEAVGRLGADRAALVAMASRSAAFERTADAGFATWSELAATLGR